MVKILVDGMGGDHAPDVIVAGVADALKKDKNIAIVLTGMEERLIPVCQKYKVDMSRVEIVHCPDVVDMNDVPTEAIRTKKESSMVKGFWMLKKDESIHAMVTAGSTGATIAGGQLIVGRIRGIKRPALAPLIPNVQGGYTLLCDCGANAECKPAMLCQFALLGTVYMQTRGIKNPKVGLVNNGTEEHKGDPMHQEAYQYLSKMEGINFVGNIEGRDIMYGDVDVAVTDGFSGNIALKTLEGCAKMILATMKKNIKSSPFALLGALFMSGGLKRMKRDLDFDNVGGAPLLGLNKVVIKSHGSSKPKTITAAILSAAEMVRTENVKKVTELLAKVDFKTLIPEEQA